MRGQQPPFRNKPAQDEFLFGIHPVLEALEAGRPLDKILLRKGIDPETRKLISDKAALAGVPIQTVPQEKLDFMVHGQNHQGVLALAGIIIYADLELVIQSCLDSGKDPLVLVLDSVTDVRNFGAIARSAECFGTHAIVIPEQGSVRVNAAAVRISSGALNHIPVCRTKHLANAIHLAKALGMQVVACHEKGKESLFHSQLSGPLMLILGSEDEGIAPGILKLCDKGVHIPMTGKVSSLNVSVAAGILLAEVSRNQTTLPE